MFLLCFWTYLAELRRSAKVFFSKSKKNIAKYQKSKISVKFLLFSANFAVNFSVNLNLINFLKVDFLAGWRAESMRDRLRILSCVDPAV